MDSSFPLPTAPFCLRCGLPCTRGITSLSSLKGNAGRPFYTCVRHTPRQFSCWDDGEDIKPEYPRCDCGFTARRSRTGGNEFLCCAAGRCNFTGDVPTGYGNQGAVDATAITVTGTTPQGVCGPSAPIPLQGASSQTDTISHDHPTTSPPQNTVGAIPHVVHVSETRQPSSGPPDSDVDGSPPPFEKPQSDRKRKSRGCFGVFSGLRLKVWSRRP